MDLDAWINEPLQEDESDSDSDVGGPSMFIKLDKSDYIYKNEKYQPELTEEERDRMREARKQEQLNNPHYLKGPSVKRSNEKNGNYENSDVGVPNIADIDLNIPLKVIPQKRSDKYLNAANVKEKKKSKKKTSKKAKKHKKDR